MQKAVLELTWVVDDPYACDHCELKCETLKNLREQIKALPLEAEQAGG